MPDLDASRPEGAEHAAHVVDLLGQGGGVRVFAVEVLAADADADDPVVAILGEGGLEGGFFGVVVVSVRGPDADEKFGVCGDGGGDSLERNRERELVGIWGVFFFSSVRGEGEAYVGKGIAV